MAETVNVKAPGGNLRITLVKKEGPAGSKGIESMKDEGTVLVYMEGPAVKIGEIIL